MIRVVNSGRFQLAETKHGTKLLVLNGQIYAWIVAPKIGAMLIYSTHPHVVTDILAQGIFYIYRVTDEPQLTDNLHLEVEIGNGEWQGYLLLTGLPDVVNTRTRIVPTRELIAPRRGRKRRIPNFMATTAATS